jgi:hypothetical protein
MKHVGRRTDTVDIVTQDQLQPLRNMSSATTAGVFSGTYYDNSFSAGAPTTIAGSADVMEVYPYFAGFNFTIDRIGVNVSTAVASAQAKVVIYSTMVTTGAPNALLYESAALDCSTTGTKEVAASLTFSAGIQYWIGIRHSSTATLRAIPLTNCKCLGLGLSTSTTYMTALRTTLAFATAASSIWPSVSSAQLVSTTPVSVRMRAL